MQSILENIKRRNEEREFFLEAFKNAGYEHIALTETRNRYMNDWGSAPWFFVTTEHGFFLLGWRRHVVHLEWGESLQVPPELFAAERELANITMSDVYIHCWGGAKLIEYLQRLKGGATVPQKEKELIEASGFPQYPAGLRRMREIEETEVLQRAHNLLYGDRQDPMKLIGPR
jgi:hypothetical protein